MSRRQLLSSSSDAEAVEEQSAWCRTMTGLSAGAGAELTESLEILDGHKQLFSREAG